MAKATVNVIGPETPEKPMGRVVVDMDKNKVVVAGKTMTINESQYNAIKDVLEVLLTSDSNFEAFSISEYEEYVEPNALNPGE